MRSPFQTARYYRRTGVRRGATLVESAIVLAVLLLILMGMMELSVALVRHTAITEAARRVARAAIVHGRMANSSLGSWGPAAIDTNAGNSDGVALAARDVLMTIDPADVTLSVRWLDGDHEPDDRVQVTVSYIHHPLVPIPGWYSQLNLTAVSVMRVAH
jgi:Flp pilus assembly protein TadG